MLHSQSTVSLIEAPNALPMRLTSPSGSDTAANARWFVIEVLNGVAGASLRRRFASAWRAGAVFVRFGAARRDHFARRTV